MRFAICCVAAGALIAQSAGAAVVNWNWNRGDAGTSGLNDNGGRFQSVAASYDTTGNQFSWSMTFSNQITEGFWLAVSPGENPKGHAGELALMYADFSRSTPVLTIYSYNGVNGDSSWYDGSGAAGTQTPDRIVSTRAGFAASMQKTDVSGRRTLSISFDADIVQGHTPLYDASRNEWTGLGFGTTNPPKLGLWCHTVTNVDSRYNSDGYLTRWNYDNQGWFDGSDYGVTRVPAPASLALIGAGLAAGLRRRRR